MLSQKESRRDFLKKTAAFASIIGLSSCRTRPNLRWLGWEHYDVPKLRRKFEEEYGVQVQAAYFDGNTEAYSRLQTGGVDDFDLVMADGYWPRQYFSDGLIVPIDDTTLPNLDGCFDEFKYPNYELLYGPDSTDMIAAPNCWGGYGMTVNRKHIPESDGTSLGLLYDERFSNHIATSARYEENIALTGILVCHQMGTTNQDRPDGKGFNPYQLWPAELEEVKSLLIKQRDLLRMRWNDEDTLERQLRNEGVWISPEWSGIFRRIHFENIEGNSGLSLDHILKPAEGGLGWVDTWCLTSGGARNQETRQLAQEWINFRLEPENMAIVADEIGWAPCVDVRETLKEKEPARAEALIETLFLNQTASIRDLYQFDIPSSVETWQQLWSEVATG